LYSGLKIVADFTVTPFISFNFQDGFYFVFVFYNSRVGIFYKLPFAQNTVMPLCASFNDRKNCDNAVIELRSYIKSER